MKSKKPQKPAPKPAPKKAAAIDLSKIIPVLLALVGNRKVRAGGKEYDLGPIIRELATDLQDGKLDAEETRRLLAVVVLAFATGVPQQAPQAPAPTQPPANPPAPSGGKMQITALKAGVMGVGDAKGPNETQLVGDRCHLDVTPTPDDPAFNETLVKPGTKTPLVLWRWGYVDGSGKRVMCSHGGPGQPDAHADRDDPWDLQSYEKKNASDTSGPGLTPVLELTEPLGPGVLHAFAYAILPAEDNDGVEVRSNEVTWKAD